MEEQKIDFFEQNNLKVCRQLAKVLLWMTLVFPVLFLATALHIFQIQYKDLAILSFIGCFCTIGPTILQKIGVPVNVMKYVSVLAVGIAIVSYFFLILSLFLRSQNVQQIEYPTNTEWFLTRSVGFTIEQILMRVVFVNQAKREYQ